MQTIQIGNVTVTKFILGSNPFSTFSHQSVEADQEMKHYFTSACIKGIMHDAERLGVNTLIARGDHHIIRLLCEFRDEGGTLQWFAQTCPELGSLMRGAENAIHNGAFACHLHGGVMDNLLANNRLDEVPEVIAAIKGGRPAGGHRRAYAGDLPLGGRPYRCGLLHVLVL